MKYFTLNNGIKIPTIGIGTNTFGKVNGDFNAEINDDTIELQTAIASGYRLIDTAIMYRNERVIGKAVREARIAREEFFITSKIPGKPEYIGTDELVKQTVLSSLKELDLDYLDLYLIHHPWDDLADIVRVWKVLETCVDEGLIKSIGVSNFSNEQLGYLLENCRIKPVLNQIQSHPDDWNDDLIDFDIANDVLPQAWGPLKRITDESMKKIVEIADKYNKTWAQIILKYQIDRGVQVIPKSHNAERQVANLAVFDFELAEEDCAILRSMK